MPKVKISEYSTTNSSNTDINSINIDEGCAPSGINNAIREVMVHLKNWQTNASGDGATFASLVVQGTGSFTGAVTMSAGTTLSGTNTLSGSNIISGNINSSGTNTFSSSQVISGNINSSGSNTFSGAQIISGNINSSGTNTFSGTTVMSGANTLALAAGSASAPSLLANGDTNTGIWFPAADTIAVSTGGSERIRLNSSGNLGLGVTPSAWFSTWKAFEMGSGSIVYPNSATNILFACNAYLINTTGDWTYKANGLASFYSQNAGQHIWYTAPSGTAGNTVSWTQAMTLDASGWLTVGNAKVVTGSGYAGLYTADTTPLIFYINTSERMRIDSSGNVTLQKNISVGGAIPSTSGAGITFPATQSASSDANTLDDYEEGSWTPTYAFSGSGSVTQTLTSGRYTKIGNRVFINFRIATSALSSPSGNVSITGLPFASTGVEGGVTPGQVSSFGINASIRVTSETSGTVLYILKSASNATAVYLQGADLAAGNPANLIDCSLSYQTS